MPVQYRTITEFLAALTPERRTEVQVLRELVDSAHPGLVENIKWNSPNYSLNGADRLTVNLPRSGPVRLVLHRGSKIAENKTAAPEFSGDPTGLLTWHSNIRASLSMPAPANQDLQGDVDTNRSRADVVAVLRAWLEFSP